MTVLATTSRAVDVLLIAVIAAALLAPLVERTVRRRFDPFEPIVVFAVAYGVMFVVRPTAMIVTDAVEYEGPRSTLDVSGTFTEMLALALLGALAFAVGYSLPLGGRLARTHAPPRRDSSDGRLVAASLLVGFVGLCPYAFVLASHGFADTVSAILRAGNTELPELTSATIYASFLFLLLVPASFVILAIGLAHRNAVLIGVSICITGLVVALALPLGNRMILLPLLGGMFVFNYVRRAARPSLSTILAVAAVAVLGSAFLSDLRGRTTRDENLVETVERAVTPSRLVRSVTTGPDTEMAPVLAAGLTVIPERLSHTYGETIFGDLVVRPIPRSLWNGKPLIPRKELIATIWPIEYERGTIDAEFSPLLYLYWDFGLLGIAFGLGAYGALARYLYEYFRLHHEHPYAQILYSLALWFVVIGVRDGPVDTFVRACVVLLPLWWIYVLARTPVRARSNGSVSAAHRASS